MISSAHLTASAIALMVAGTLLPARFIFCPGYALHYASFHNLEFAVFAQLDLELSALTAVELLHSLGAVLFRVTFQWDVQACRIKSHRVVACVGVEIQPLRIGQSARLDALAPNEAASLSSALKKQLGLELREQTAPVQVLVIDHSVEVTNEE